MKLYIKSTLNDDDSSYIANVRTILLPYAGKDEYVKVMYYDSALRHPQGYKTIYIKILDITNKTCEARCFDGLDISLPLTNEYNVLYPPRYRRLALNRIGVSEDLQSYTFEELCDIAGKRKPVNMPSADLRKFY